jgi:short-subunit dehydrogenase
MTVDVRGRRVLVTGASRGLGVYVAKALAAGGAELILSARDRASLDATASACEALGARVEVVAASLDRADERARLIEGLLATGGALDILINNAGVEHTKGLLDQSDAEVQAQLELNLHAPIDLIRRVLPAMLARGRGTIVNISSMSGKGATPFNSIYAATKHGLNGLTSSLRAELEDTGVHVGVVCPGPVAAAGMWARTGVAAPRAIAEVEPEAVVAGVWKVLAGASEVLVTRGPIRPMLALRELLPGLERPLLRALGISAAMRERAGRS